MRQHRGVGGSSPLLNSVVDAETSPGTDRYGLIYSFPYISARSDAPHTDIKNRGIKTRFIRYCNCATSPNRIARGDVFSINIPRGRLF